MSTLTKPTVTWSGSSDPASPLVLLLHGRGSNEAEISSLVAHLAVGPAYAAVRAPIGEEGGYAWFANRGVGRPVAESLEETMLWFRTWLDSVTDRQRPVILVGFSGGAAFAGALLLQEPERFKGAAILYGTLPFDAGVPPTPGRLKDANVFVAQGDDDTVIPRELLDRTWEYITGESGAHTMTVRHSGGHGIGQDALVQLVRWLEDLATSRDETP